MSVAFTRNFSDPLPGQPRGMRWGKIAPPSNRCGFQEASEAIRWMGRYWRLLNRLAGGPSTAILTSLLLRHDANIKDGVVESVVLIEYDREP
jgi:hypothetical protein